MTPQIEHDKPHFISDGTCVCEQPCCTRIVGERPDVIIGQCICPECPCANGMTKITMSAN